MQKLRGLDEQGKNGGYGVDMKAKTRLLNFLDSIRFFLFCKTCCCEYYKIRIKDGERFNWHCPIHGFQDFEDFDES